VHSLHLSSVLTWYPHFTCRSTLFRH